MPLRYSLALIGCLTGFLAAPAAGARAADPGPAAPLVIPMIDLPGGAIGLHATIAGHDGLFLFDTGAGVTLLTPATASISGCRPWGQVTGFRATGERLDLQRCDDVRLRIGGRDFPVPTASVLDIQRLMPPRTPALAGVLALDAFVGQVITIRRMAHQLVVETAASLPPRIAGATQVQTRMVRDAEGLALTMNAAVQTPAGRAWMELDTGNAGPIMVDTHVAQALGLSAAQRTGQTADFKLAGGIPVQGQARVSSLIMDGDIGAAVLGGWDLTFDLAGGRVWFRPSAGAPPAPE